MFRSSHSSKQTVDLSRAPAKVSRIRRDPPPPPARKVMPSELRASEAKVIVVGLTVFGLAIAILLFQAARWAGWSPADYTIVIRDTR
jgi:hypothetical protein